jgi:hypothetical protein
MWRDRETDRVTSPHWPVTREIGDPTVHPERSLGDAAIFGQLAAQNIVSLLLIPTALRMFCRFSIDSRTTLFVHFSHGGYYSVGLVELDVLRAVLREYLLGIRG